MTAVLLVSVLLSQPEPSQSGYATYYADGLMQTVANNRRMDLGAYAGGVALNDCADLGRTVWLEFDGATFGPLLSVDCAQPQHHVVREQQGRVVEVDADLARLVGFYGVGPHPVRVMWEEPEGWRRWE